MLLRVIAAIEKKAWFLFFGNKWNATILLPLLLMSTKYRLKIGEKELFILQFPVFVFGCKIFSLSYTHIGRTDVIYYMTQNFLHSIEAILENTSSLKNVSTLKATLEKNCIYSNLP